MASLGWRDETGRPSGRCCARGGFARARECPAVEDVGGYPEPGLSCDGVDCFRCDGAGGGNTGAGTRLITGHEDRRTVLRRGPDVGIGHTEVNSRVSSFHGGPSIEFQALDRFMDRTEM